MSPGEKGETDMSENTIYDLAVIGAGPGGYVAAIRAAQLDMKVAIIEQMESPGGTCLNVGCIPSKAMLDSSNRYHEVEQILPEHGIQAKAVTLDLEKMLERKQAVVKKLTGGVDSLIKGNKIARIEGRGVLNQPGSSDIHTIQVYDHDERQWERSSGGLNQYPPAENPRESKTQPREEIKASRVLLATGSVPVELPFMPFDGGQILSSTGALSLTDVPKSMAIIGAGAIGLEMASVWASLGSKVTVIEMMDQILPGWDSQLARTLMRDLKKLGIEFILKNSVTKAKQLKSSVKLTLENDPGEVKAEKVLVAVGRRPALESAGIREAGIGLDDDGRRIAVDEDYQTSIPGVYAIGDLIHGPMLAHKAEEDGVTAVERMAGIPAHFDYAVIPGVVYTHPEGATVGVHEDELKKAGTEYAKGVFPIPANGRALAMGVDSGFVKILADAKTDRILGAQILSPWASDLISEVVSVMEMKGSSEDIARIVHAHPTLPEAVKEAALAVKNRSIHSLR